MCVRVWQGFRPICNRVTGMGLGFQTRPNYKSLNPTKRKTRKSFRVYKALCLSLPNKLTTFEFTLQNHVRKAYILKFLSNRGSEFYLGLLCLLCNLYVNIIQKVTIISLIYSFNFFLFSSITRIIPVTYFQLL